jgi:S1-C subfamily serine protease
MSGLDVIYSGKQLVKERKTLVENLMTKGRENSKTINFISSFSYKFKPSFKIRNVVEGSPAAIAGLQKDDIILKINNSSAVDLTLQIINQKFQERDNKRIRITVLRNEEKIKYEFYLEKKI